MAVHFVPPGPETGPIDWSLRANDLGEIVIPFARHVKPDSLHRAHGNFSAFAQLPAELQLHIVGFCDGATLFQLMQTSAALRHEAEKLFWSDPDAWYRVDGNWLLRGGFSGEAHFGTDFLRQVQQVEVGVEDVEWFLPPDSEDGSRAFWGALQLQFPRVVRVVVSEETAREAQSMPPSNFHKMAEDCPTGIDFYGSVATLQEPNTNLATRSRTGVKVLDGHQDVTESPWVRKTIIIPPKVWRGPAGEYAEALSRDKQHVKKGCIWDVLVIQAIERDCLGDQGQVFSCPRRGPVCGLEFAKGRDWAAHATKTGHHLDAEMPALYKDEFVRQQKDNPFKILNEKYQKLDKQEREALREGILNQLEQDPDCAEGHPVQRRDVWNLYLESASGYVRPQVPL